MQRLEKALQNSHDDVKHNTTSPPFLEQDKVSRLHNSDRGNTSRLRNERNYFAQFGKDETNRIRKSFDNFSDCISQHNLNNTARNRINTKKKVVNGNNK